MASYAYPEQTTSPMEGSAKGAITGSQYGGQIGAYIGGVFGYLSQKKRNKAQQSAQDKLTKALNNRPVYKRQAEWDENVKQAKGVQSMYEPLTKTNTLPGQAYMQNRIDANSANTVSQGVATGVTSPSQLVQLLAGANKTQQDAQVDLSIAGAQNRQANMGNYASATNTVMGANKDLAREKDVEWDTNVQQPWITQTDMARDTFNDALGRNRKKSDQESAAAMNSLNYQRDFITSMIPMIAGGGAGGGGIAKTSGIGIGSGQTASASAGSWNNGRLTR